MNEERQGLDSIKNSNICSLEEIITNRSHVAEAEMIANEACQTISEHGGNVSEANKQILKTAAMVLLEDFKETDSIAVIPAEPGLGKSTLIEEYLKHQLSIDPDFGAIVVKERVRDVKALETALIGKAKALYSFNSEECLKGSSEYRRVECRNCQLVCNVQKTRIEQKNYPVVMITAEKLRMLMLYKKDLGELDHYYDKEGQKKNRSVLIIDEKPPITINKPISRKELQAVYSVMQRIKNDSAISNEAIQLNNHIKTLNQDLSSLKRGMEYYNPINPDYKLSNELKKRFDIFYEGNDAEIIEQIACLINNGGVIRYDEANINLQGEIITTEYLDYYSNLKTVIFDASAIYDAEYRNGRFVILDMPAIRDYSKFQINNCKKINLSRSNMLRMNRFIDFNSLLRDLSFISDKEIFILTYMKNEYSVCKAVDNSAFKILNKEVHIDHFNNVKGKNEYAAAEVMLMIGINYKTDAFYLAKAKSLGIKVSGTAYKNTKNGRLCSSREIMKIVESDIFTDTLQNVYRTKLRRDSNDLIKLYCFIPYANVMGMLKQYFRNCSYNNWFPEEFYDHYLNNETRHDHKILDLVHFLVEQFSEDPDGQIKLSINKEEIGVAVGYKNKGTLANHLKSDYVLFKLQQLGVKVCYHTLEKTTEIDKKQFAEPREEMVV